MSPALEKLKAKLFSKHTPEQLGVVAESEKALQPSRGSVGGLGYDCLPGLRNPKTEITVTIEHEARDQFYVYVFVDGPTRIASQRISFAVIDRDVKRLIQLVRDEN